MSKNQATGLRMIADRGLQAVETLGANIGGITVLVMAVHVATDVILRVAVNDPVAGTLEVSSYWYMIAIVMLSLAYTEREDSHIVANILTGQLTGAIKQISAIIKDSLALLMVVLLTFNAVEAAVTSTIILETSSGSIALALWPAKIAVAIGFSLIAARLFVSILGSLKALSARKVVNNAELV